MYKIIFEKKAKKEFCKLSHDIQLRIKKVINEKLLSNPDLYLIPLLGDKSGYYKFRVGDYRLLCKKQDKKLIIIVLKIKHRREVYN